VFPSELASGLIASRDPSKEDPSELRFIPARRFGGEEEMAGTALYLASRAGAVSHRRVIMFLSSQSSRACIEAPEILICFAYKRFTDFDAKYCNGLVLVFDGGKLSNMPSEY
jgi:NAD(P)-dependent dehydrogenase (short-subunit alcohol dehydrogenase family)